MKIIYTYNAEYAEKIQQFCAKKNVFIKFLVPTQTKQIEQSKLNTI